MKHIFINASNHNLTDEQKREVAVRWGAEIVELPEELKKSWGDVTPDNFKLIARDFLDLVQDKNVRYIIHLAGQPALVCTLVQILKACNIEVVWAYSKRVSVEETQVDGTVIKKNIFKHEGFFGY